MSQSRSIYRSLFADPAFPLFIVLAGSFFLTVFFRISASVILPLEGERLGMSASLVGFISSVHFYAYALMQPVSGILHDRYGPVRVVTCGLLLTAVSCLLLTVVRTPLSLGVWRLVSGFGVSPMYSATLVFMAFAFPAERYCFYAGINFALSSLGAIVSVAPLGFALDTFGLPATFAILSAISLMMALFLGRRSKFDPMRKPGKQEKTLSSILPGIGRAILFIFRNRRMRSLMILWAVSSASLLTFQGLWGVAWFSVAFQVSQGSARFWSSLISAGMMLGPLMAGGVILSPDKLPRLIGFMSSLNSLCWFILLGSTVSGLPVWAGGAAALLLGAVTGVRGVFALAGVTALAPTEERGVVFGAMNMMAVLSAVIFQWGTGIVIDRFPATQPGVYTTEGYFTAFLLVSSATAVSLLALRSLGRDPLKGE
nr:MFS transporter [uncultured Dethiosulfovibrio sp.]